MSAFILLLLAGGAFCTSTISGLLGMAGGISLIALMTALLPASQVIPIHGAVQLASNFTRTLVYFKHVHWRVFFYFAPPLMLGVLAAVSVWTGGEMLWFRPLIGVFVLCVLVWRRFQPKLRNLPYWTYVPLGLCAGFLTIFIGAIGPFIAPFFLRDDFPKERVIATKAVCQWWAHLMKLPAFLSLGFDYGRHWPLMTALFAAVILGTFAGRWLLDKIEGKAFVRLYEAVLSAVAVYLIYKGLA